MSFFIKRSIDVMVAGTGLLVLAPVLAAVAVSVRLSMGAPVLFLQVRPGYRGRPFLLYKFRSMREARGPDGEPLSDDERLTRLGRFLRMMSLDELPQLWNVLRGDLSLVGPRPLLLQYLPLYTPEQARRHVWSDADRELVADRIDTQFVGTPGQVADQLERLRDATEADELIITTITYDHADRVRSYQLLAEEWARR